MVCDSDPLSQAFPEINGGPQLHLRTCALLFHVSEMAGPIALKLGAWLETH